MSLQEHSKIKVAKTKIKFSVSYNITAQIYYKKRYLYTTKEINDMNLSVTHALKKRNFKAYLGLQKC